MDAFQQDIVDLLPRLRRLARALARHTADADDLVQLTVERAIAREGQWRPGTRLDSWMFMIMKNAWIDETRSRRRSGRVFSDADHVDEIPDITAPDMQMRLEASAAERAIAALPEEQRIAVALVLVEGLSYREAAEVLEIPIGTLTSRLVRGRMTLMAQLDGLEV